MATILKTYFFKSAFTAIIIFMLTISLAFAQQKNDGMVIDFIEKTRHPKFASESINFLFNKTLKDINAGFFLNCVLTKRQKFNHQLGFLNLNEKFLAQQKKDLRRNIQHTFYFVLRGW